MIVNRIRRIQCISGSQELCISELKPTGRTIQPGLRLAQVFCSARGLYRNCIGREWGIDNTSKEGDLGAGISRLEDPREQSLEFDTPDIR